MNAAMEVRSANIEQEGVPQTLAELMALALAMEREAAQRYAEFADAMEIHNNVEVAALFRKMATIETGHVQAIMLDRVPLNHSSSSDCGRRLCQQES